jgi:hypothetical protein
MIMMNWIFDFMDLKWYLFRDDEDEAIAEVGQEDAELEGDKSYYWIECDSCCGYGDYPTMNEAKAEAEAYFNL